MFNLLLEISLYRSPWRKKFFFFLQRLSENAAMNLRVTTARLPIKEYMMPGGDPHKLDLPIDVVVKILLAVHHSGDWKQALREHFPKRKGWVMRDW